MFSTHYIPIEADVPVSSQKKTAALIRRAVKAVLLTEGIAVPCEVSVLLTDDAGIREINLEQRQIDAATDVLSFPMLELAPGVSLQDKRFADPGSGLTVLGDMVLNLERMRQQAEEFGHSYQRELCYLVVHSVLHLLGYDHLDEGTQKRAMRAREEAILKTLGITREG